MPNYKTHDKAAYIAAPAVFAATYTITTIEYASIITFTFLLANYYLSPDLDIDSIMIRRWGILYFIWYPYKKLFHHRSIWTHSGPLSATIRAAYLSLWLVPVFLLLSITVPVIYVLFLYIGMILADSLHSVLDRVL